MNIYLSIEEFCHFSGLSRNFICTSKHIVRHDRKNIDVIKTTDSLDAYIKTKKITPNLKDFESKVLKLKKKVSLFLSDKRQNVSKMYISTQNAAYRFNIEPCVMTRILKKASDSPEQFSNQAKSKAVLYELNEIDAFAERHKIGKFSFHHARAFVMGQYSPVRENKK